MVGRNTTFAVVAATWLLNWAGCAGDGSQSSPEQEDTESGGDADTDGDTDTQIGAPTIYYDQSFENEWPVGTPDPIWGVVANAANAFGPGDLFEITTEQSYVGSYSLRFNYEGKNGICNTCGNTARVQKTGFNGVSYFVDSAGVDLTLDPILAAVGRIVYNKTNSWSKWQITSLQNEDATNDRLNLALVADPMDESTAQFNADDDSRIMRVCGVDGLIGGNIDRRSDCDGAISWMTGVAQDDGQSLFRRMYLRYSSGTVFPDNTQKLYYWTTGTGTLYSVFHFDNGTGKPFIAVGSRVPSVHEMDQAIPRV